jgi:pimeloyl-ACP methyl ester carboxylesterase
MVDVTICASFSKAAQQSRPACPRATVLRFSTEFLIRIFFAAISFAAIRRRWCVRSLVCWLFADLLRKNLKRFDATVDWLVTIMRSLQPRGLPFPTVLTDADWGALRMPTLFLAGEHETIYAADKAVRRLKRAAPQVRVEIIPGAGHDLTMVQAEMVNRIILDFLTQEPAASKMSGTGTWYSDRVVCFGRLLTRAVPCLH